MRLATIQCFSVPLSYKHSKYMVVDSTPPNANYNVFRQFQIGQVYIYLLALFGFVIAPCIQFQFMDDFNGNYVIETRNRFSF